MKVGLVQHRAGANKEENLERAVAGIREAAGAGAELVCLQELFASRYFPQVEDSEYFELAERIDGPTRQRVAEVAKTLAVTVMTSLFERRAPGICHNTLLVLGPDGSELGRYRKMHIPDDPQFFEKFYFTPGDLGYRAVPVPSARTESVHVGPLVCWDQWFPEAARLTAMQGAELLFYPTAIGWLPDEKASQGAEQLDAWKTMMRSHAIANGVFSVAVNRVGVEASDNGSIEFWGHSLVVAPSGKVLCELGTEEEVRVVECDLGALEATRRAWPFFRDRRIDSYGDLSKRWSR